MARGQDTGNHPGRRVDRGSATEAWRRKMLGAMSIHFGDDVASAYDEGLFGNRPNTPEAAVSAGAVTPTSKSEMGGLHGSKCPGCGSFNTDKSEVGASCYDCGHDY